MTGICQITEPSSGTVRVIVPFGYCGRSHKLTWRLCRQRLTGSLQRCCRNLCRDLWGYLAIGIPSGSILAIGLLHGCGPNLRTQCVTECLRSAGAGCDCTGTLIWALLPVSLVFAAWLGWSKWLNGSLARMRDAMVILGLAGITVMSAAALGWGWLIDGTRPNSQVVQHLALGAAAILTLLFVIWRERIASENASFEQFKSGVQMLGDPNIVTRIAGVRLLARVGRFPRWRGPVLKVLRTFDEDASSDPTAEGTPALREDVLATRALIRRLRSMP